MKIKYTIKSDILPPGTWVKVQRISGRGHWEDGSNDKVMAFQVICAFKHYYKLQGSDKNIPMVIDRKRCEIVDPLTEKVIYIRP